MFFFLNNYTTIFRIILLHQKILFFKYMFYLSYTSIKWIYQGLERVDIAFGNDFFFQFFDCFVHIKYMMSQPWIRVGNIIFSFCNESRIYLSRSILSLPISDEAARQKPMKIRQVEVVLVEASPAESLILWLPKIDLCKAGIQITAAKHMWWHLQFCWNLIFSIGSCNLKIGLPAPTH